MLDFLDECRLVSSAAFVFLPMSFEIDNDKHLRVCRARYGKLADGSERLEEAEGSMLQLRIPREHPSFEGIWCWTAIIISLWACHHGGVNGFW